MKPQNSVRMTRKLREYHNEVHEKYYPDVAHIGIVLALAKGFRDKAPVLNDISDFIHAHEDGLKTAPPYHIYK